MSQSRETPEEQSFQETMLKDDISGVGGIFARYAKNLKIYHYDYDSEENSVEDPSGVLLSGILNINEPGRTGAIELLSTVKNGLEQITITISIMDNSESRGLINQELYLVTSTGVRYGDNSSVRVDWDDIYDLRYWVDSADYSLESQIVKARQTTQDN